MKRQFWGVVLIALGVLAMLQAMGQYNFGLEFWPVVLTLLGLSILWSTASRRPSWMGIALGLWIGGMGLFDILNNAGITVLDGGDIARNGWPLLVIAIGISLIFGKRMGWRGVRVKVDNKSHVVGEMRYGQSSWVLDKDISFDHGIGDVRLDLTTAEISEGLHQISVNCWVGEVLVRVPDNVSVTVDSSVNVGELEVLGERRSGMSPSLQKSFLAPESNVQLKIDARLGIGSLRIIQRPAAQRFTL